MSTKTITPATNLCYIFKVTGPEHLREINLLQKFNSSRKKGETFGSRKKMG